jgi:hypothetical protein
VQLLRCCVGAQFVEAVVRLYGVAFGLLIVLAEREWRTFFTLFVSAAAIVAVVVAAH